MKPTLRSFFFDKRYHFSRFEFNLVAVIFVSLGLIGGTYFAINKVLPQIFASTTWTQTDWSGGSGSSTTTQYSAISNLDATTVSGQVTLSPTSNWYSTSWKYRRKITFDNTTSSLGVTSEALTNFPVLVKLTSSTIDYANTQDAGQDLRFTDSDGTTLLSYQIESWDESGTSYVWVKVPSIDINSNTDYIYAYYGNTVASDAQAATSVWDSNYKSIFHMNETSGLTVSDSTSTLLTGNKIGASNPAPTTSGYIGNAQNFNGTSDYIDVPNGYTSTLQTASTYSISLWLKPTAAALSGSKVLFDAINCGSLCVGLQFNGTSGLYWWTGGAYRTYTGINFVAETWYNIVINKTGSGNTGDLYVNGALKSTYSGTIGSIANTASTLRIGQYQSGSYYIGGILDEFRMSNTSRSLAYLTAQYKSDTDSFNTFSSQEARYQTSGTLTSNILDTSIASAWETLSYTSSGSTVTVKARTSNDSGMSGATAFASCDAITSGSDISSNNCVTDGHRYIQYQISLSTADASVTPTLSDISILYSPYDIVAPSTNASSIAMSSAYSGGRSIASNGWNNGASPYFSWTAGADDVGGSGLLGYCLYLGTDSAGDPSTSEGVLGTSPVSTTNTTCQFIVSSTSVNLATSGYLGSALVSGTTYYLNIKAIDNGSNLYGGGSAQFQFRQDVTVPTNVAYVSAASGNFGNVVDMNFNWPISGGSAAADADSGVLGYQYQVNSSSGTWKGTSTSSECGLDYIPAATSSYFLTQEDDGDDITTGTNVIYYRTVDSACNTSSSSTYRTASISYGGAAPSFSESCDSTTGITVSPSTSTSNSYSLSWADASPSSGRTLSKYYYMINTSPPSTLSTITGNTTTYLSNGTQTSVSSGTLVGSIRGANTVYVVAVDDADNYSSSNCLKGTYTLNSTNPDPPLNLAATDASVKATSLWRVSLGWDVPAYKGAGTLTYKVQRSTDNTNWTEVTTTSGTSYIDTVSESRLYYWRVGAYDTSSASQADPSYASSVSKTPKGTYTDPASLTADPVVSAVTTKKAKISWSTSRLSDSKVQYGTKSGDYFTEEPSNSSQTTDHAINLISLSPGTTYYYKVKWTDEDGNTGTSSEKSFATDPAPTVTDPKAKSIGLSSATLEYTVTGASRVKIYYGTTTAFGGLKEVSTSIASTTYTTELTGLNDGTKYYYKINIFDSEDVEYDGNILVLETLPRPKISNVRIQQVSNTAQSTLLVSWLTNTEVSSIITYYPQDAPANAHDEINVALITGEHKLILRSLLPQTVYTLLVKGRDRIGNEATSDSQKVTTATDTRPPQITDLKVEGSTVSVPSAGTQEQQAQLVVSWNTDEPSTSQVEFGEGTGSTYAQKTQQDSNLTTNHLVIISGLTPSKVYHLRALAKDKADNIGKSIDTVSISPKGTDNALNLVIQSLQQVFGFIGGIQK